MSSYEMEIIYSTLFQSDILKGGEGTAHYNQIFLPGMIQGFCPTANYYYYCYHYFPQYSRFIKSLKWMERLPYY